MRIPEAILVERDAQIYRARLAGNDFRTIGKSLNVSASTAHAGYLRELKRRANLGQEEMENAAFKQLDQLDAMLRSIWHMTKEREMELPGSGEMVTVPPSLDAIDRCQRIIAMQAKILGTDKENLSLGYGGQQPAIGNSESGTKEITSETAARELARQMFQNKVLDGPIADVIRRMLAEENIDDADIEDAVVLDDTTGEPQRQLPASTGGDEPPEWLDDDDEAYVPGGWVPTELETGGKYANAD